MCTSDRSGFVALWNQPNRGDAVLAAFKRSLGEQDLSLVTSPSYLSRSGRSPQCCRFERQRITRDVNPRVSGGADTKGTLKHAKDSRAATRLCRA